MKASFVNCHRMFLLLFSFFLLSFAASADPGADEVSTEVLLRFANSFSAAKNVSWKVTKEFSKASFTVDNKLTEVFYNRRNRLMGTAEHITLQELPAGGADNIKCDYAKYAATSAIRYTNARGEVFYFVQLETGKRKMIVQVDEQGTPDCVRMETKQNSKRE